MTANAEEPRFVGYTVLKSADNTTMVQIFTDLETGQLVRASVATRAAAWGTWGPPTEVEKVAP